MTATLADAILYAWRKRFPNNAYAWPGVPEEFAIEAARVLVAGKTDVKTLEKLADKIDEDSNELGGLNPAAMHSIVDIIRRAIGAPLSWPSRTSGNGAARSAYDKPDLQDAFNAGVKWAVEQYHDLNIDQVKPR